MATSRTARVSSFWSAHKRWKRSAEKPFPRWRAALREYLAAWFALSWAEQQRANAAINREEYGHPAGKCGRRVG
jgi:hypothetical protein